MRVEFNIQPNCSECAIVIYPDKLSKAQKQIFVQFCTKKGLKTKKTKKGNFVIESSHEDYPSDKQDLWELSDDLEFISDWSDNKIKREIHFDLIRDESYEDMLEDGSI